ncbi:MAG: DUF465 domain-containing protein [Gammaproteobacteria bacterium]|jgi:hypothetical protein|nr:DUF465 domain-containing protein [Pseudomonadota bacterium]MCZ6499127.1 DUF465 domain-containing protein [Gammaproteobacteria bacterium]MCZ6716076.1 DUF465 domain-containing protein [Gammaproteobacteria bacterium]MCZ6826697.1 DUF465 domain-containing protein [Gammaproteobacteria bacterium]MCZ6911437.1 DUF465 domain-containing protein [Pseudomonadota bacterium]
MGDKINTEVFGKLRKLKLLRMEHRDLDEVIVRLSQDPFVDQLMLKRLKKRKLLIKDSIERLQSEMIPDLNA